MQQRRRTMSSRSLAGWRARHQYRLARHGISLIEMLVVLGIVSLLIAIVLPAVQSARESARRATCISHLHQIGVALEAFQASQGRGPAGSILSTANTMNLAPQVELLPYLDQAPVFDQFDRNELGTGIENDPPTSPTNSGLLPVAIPVYVCPSDSIGGVRCNYRISAGTSPWLHETSPKSPQAALQGYRSLLGRRDAEFQDGKSNTAAFAEKLAGDHNSDRYTPWRDMASIVAGGSGLATPDDALKACQRPLDAKPKHFSYGGTTWVLSGYPQTWYNHVLTPNSEVPDCVDGGPLGHGAYTARSLHPGGVNVLFADGRVTFNSTGIDLAVWRAVGSVAGGEVITE